jgi:hypothetical protein
LLPVHWLRWLHVRWPLEERQQQVPCCGHVVFTQRASLLSQKATTHGLLSWQLVITLGALGTTQAPAEHTFSTTAGMAATEPHALPHALPSMSLARPQIPLAFPVRAWEQAPQPSLQALSQQTPSTQWPPLHSLSFPQDAPCGWFVTGGVSGARSGGATSGIAGASGTGAASGTSGDVSGVSGFASRFSGGEASGVSPCGRLVGSAAAST